MIQPFVQKSRKHLPHLSHRLLATIQDLTRLDWLQII